MSRVSQHHVPALEIRVDEAQAVQQLQGSEELLGDRSHVGDVEPPLAIPLQQVPQAHAQLLEDHASL